MSDVKTLHDEDFLAWSKDQAQALRTGARAGSNQKLDWENLAEEIEGLGISQRHALHSQIERIIRRLLKLEHSPAAEPRRRWEESIDDARSEIELLLAQSPSLAGEIPAAIAAGCNRGSRKAIRDLVKYDELDAATAAHPRGHVHRRTSSRRLVHARAARLARNTHDDSGGDIRGRRPYICPNASPLGAWILKPRD